MGTHMEVAISDRSLLLRLNRFTWVLNRFNGESIHGSDSIGSFMNRFSLSSNRFIGESILHLVESIHGFCLDFFTLCSSRLFFHTSRSLPASYLYQKLCKTHLKTPRRCQSVKYGIIGTSINKSRDLGL